MKIINSEYSNTHKSNHKDTKWYIDTIEKNKSGYRISGWIVNYEESISSIVVNRTEYKWSDVSTSRDDVDDIYGDTKTPNVGFNISGLDIEDLYKDVSVYFGDKDYPIVLGNISKFLTYNPKEESKSSTVSKVESNEVELVESDNNLDVGELNSFSKRELIIVDNFYTDPDKVRDYAINNMEFIGDSDFYRGNRTEETFTIDGTKERFEELLGKKIVGWNDGSYKNGMFQWCPGDTPIVYHVDQQQYAAIVFLTPNPPLNSGTKTYRSKITGVRQFSDEEVSTDNPDYLKTFSGYGDIPSFYESVSFEEVDSVANIYNRLVIWNASSIHAASNYFGDSINNSRLFQLFFFDVE